ncbi:hypothetical protein M0812_06841 [Anaeramoeba flamelloides]|uniref:Uncharacterized protein n=1 Tax=Anaeramoeba flamelloides TaxID=1746091 RepID=A0AAV8A949_9EUKA|nr:hypothetical protein M0812_06841 [Anaeramoeba flamelloides]
MHKRPRTFTRSESAQNATFVTSSSTTSTAQTSSSRKRQNIYTVTKYMRLIDNQTNPELSKQNYDTQSNQICSINIPKINYTGLQRHNQKEVEDEEEENSTDKNGNGGNEGFLFNVNEKNNQEIEIENYKNKKKINKIRDLKQFWDQKNIKSSQTSSFEFALRKRKLPNNNWESSLINEQKSFSEVNDFCYTEIPSNLKKRRRENLKSSNSLLKNKNNNNNKNKNKNQKKNTKKNITKRKKKTKRKQKKNFRITFRRKQLKTKRKNKKNLKTRKQSKRIRVISRICNNNKENVSSVDSLKSDQKTVRLEKKMGSLSCEHNVLKSKVHGLKMEKLQLKKELIQLQLLLKQKQLLDSLSTIKNISTTTPTPKNEKETETETETEPKPEPEPEPETIIKKTRIEIETKSITTSEKIRMTNKNNLNNRSYSLNSIPKALSSLPSLPSLSSSYSTSSCSCSGSYTCSCSGSYTMSGSCSSSQIETPTSEPLINYELDGSKFIIDNSEEEEEEEMGLSIFKNTKTLENENATAESEEETCFYWQSLQRKTSKMKRYLDEEYPVLIEQVLYNKVQISRRTDRLRAKLAILRWLCHLDLYLRMMGEEGLDWNEILYGSSHKREFLQFVHRMQDKVKLSESLALQIYEHDVAISKKLLSNDMIMDNVKAQIQEFNLNENLYSYLHSSLLHSQKHYNQLPKSENKAFQILRRSDSESERIDDKQDKDKDNENDDDDDVEILENFETDFDDVDQTDFDVSENNKNHDKTDCEDDDDISINIKIKNVDFVDDKNIQINKNNFIILNKKEEVDGNEVVGGEGGKKGGREREREREDGEAEGEGKIKGKIYNLNNLESANPICGSQIESSGIEI